mmetsp:Transcript_112110/g.327963  ORF Transcript_112110/g.327963 Transcript_112110/m.327963 type:complete len:249 (-) Transcript_112110:82-828(-)
MGLPPVSRCCRRCRGRPLVWEASCTRDGSAWSCRRTVLCFGDSLTEGFCQGGRVFRPYSGRLAQRLRQLCAASAPAVVNAGESGETTRQMLERLPAFVAGAPRPAGMGSEDSRPIQGPRDVVLILGGTNDLPSLSAERIVDNLLELHRMVHRAGAVSGVLTVPDVRVGMELERQPFKEKQQFVNEKLRAFAEQSGGCSFLVDVAAALPQDSAHAELWEPDGVHMSERGYHALGELLAGACPPPLLGAS